MPGQLEKSWTEEKSPLACKLIEESSIDWAMLLIPPQVALKRRMKIITTATKWKRNWWREEKMHKSLGQMKNDFSSQRRKSQRFVCLSMDEPFHSKLLNVCWRGSGSKYPFISNVIIICLNKLPDRSRKLRQSSPWLVQRFEGYFACEKNCEVILHAQLEVLMDELTKRSDKNAG